LSSLESREIPKSELSAGQVSNFANTYRLFLAAFALLALSETLHMAKRKIKRDGDDLGMVLGMARGVYPLTPSEIPQNVVIEFIREPGNSEVRTFRGSGSH
jgi:hypothetical protein